MSRLGRTLVGALLASLAYVSILAAQGQNLVTLPDLLSGIGFTAGAGALIAWGSQKEQVKGHSERLDKLEDDRVTRHEFETMGGTIRNIESDVRQIREMLERRQSPRSRND